MSDFKSIPGGICAPKGFSAAGVHCGIRHNHSKLDLALIKADVRCAGAGCYTTNKVYGAPITVDREHLKDGYAQAIVVNSGNANTCAPNGVQLAKDTCDIVAKELGIRADDVLPSSTGVIGQAMSIEPFAKGIPEAAAKLAADEAGSHDAATAIMTTDTHPKEIALEFAVGGKAVRIGAIAKGSGMIHPNMATMLLFMTTDAKVAPAALQKALSTVVPATFNQISVDGDTSTNDTCVLMANGMAGNVEITEKGEAYALFVEALSALCVKLARQMARDGEGAKHLITCTVSGAESVEQAQALSKSVISSTLTKAAIFGCDANWGRVLCAMGYSKAPFRPEFVDVKFRSVVGEVLVCRQGAGVDFDEAYSSPFSPTTQLYYGDDLQEIAFGMKEIDEPGVNFIYQSGVTQLLGFIVEKATGEKLSDYVSRKLWTPMHAEESALWSLDRKDGMEKAYCCFNSNARDFARFGQLLLNNGQWDDRQLISPAYLAEATSPDTRLVYKDLGKPNHCYGFQYWILDYKGMKIPYMRGILGQYVFTLPEKNAVIVRLGHKRSDTYTADQHYPDDINTWLDAAMDLLQ